jgi:quinol monooxygenase YgiN
MIVEYIRYTIPAEQQEAFVRDYIAAREPLLRSPYALDFEVSQCSEDGTHFIVRIEWTSADDHLDKFRGSPEFRTFFQRVRSYVRMIDEMRHYHVR